MRTIVRRFALALAALGITGFVAGSGQLLARHVQMQQGEGAVASPGVPAAYAQAPTSMGRFEADLVFTSLDAPGNGEASARVVWDDAWFTQDERIYNDQLAHTASVIAALAYSESGYYQASNACPPYMERALGQLGFSDVDTDSYRYRSEVVDEVLGLVTNQADGVAYTLARKRLTSSSEGPDSRPRGLILVSVRGSYGSEWLSNLDLSSDEAGDYGGYVRAAREISREVEQQVARSCSNGAEASVLLTGHSRGGAVANLVAAELNNARAASNMPEARIYAYTFAAPATTLQPQARSSRYANIFNVINPSDIMPHLPLETWGYERYGVDVLLPHAGEKHFEERFAEMQAAYERSVGVPSAADPADAHAVQAICSGIAESVPSAKDLVSPAGAAAVLGAVARHADPVRILYSHYPSTYIAWLEVLAGR
ncbi:MAG: lipase family protein [Coriobacteriaceae bacterium]|nr:lipase family protein [Coriobacteriaceae bacterium]